MKIVAALIFTLSIVAWQLWSVGEAVKVMPVVGADTVIMGGDGYAYSMRSDGVFQWVHGTTSGRVAEFPGLPHGELHPVTGGLLATRWQDGVWWVSRGQASMLIPDASLITSTAAGDGAHYLQVLPKGDRLMRFYLLRDGRAMPISSPAQAHDE